MAAKVKSKRLVIDASVARSAGGKDAIYPTSVHCRDFLQAVLDICHKVVMTREMKAEWDKHQSKFARTWMRQMVARKKFEYLSDIPSQKALWEKIQKVLENDPATDRELWDKIEAAHKDFLLLEAALASDKIIISLDDRVKKHFHRAAIQVGELRAIAWINPTQSPQNVRIWLTEGAAIASFYLLATLP
jgi:hypothetical protein